ncbi:hypothetical protein HDU67_007876, partial [Dinochytrium kinnereticum]
MTPVDALGVAVAGVGRACVSVMVGGVVAGLYARLFARFKGGEGEEYKAERSKVHQQAAEWLLWLARTQGGIYVKAAQHIASLTYVVPSEYTTTLSVLQDRAPFRPWSVMGEVLRSELGVSELKEVFLEVQETPIAAASLAQVHKALTRDNEPVAVKIQYPDVARLFIVDTSTMQLLSTLASTLFPDFSFGWIVTEFRESLSSEFDFTEEARNALSTHERFHHRRSAVRCPLVRWDLTTRRVLTMEFVDGVKVNDAAGLRGLGLDPGEVGRLVCEVFAEMVFCHGVVHCDPHPGNMVVVSNLPLLLTGRPAGSTTPLGGEISQEERARIRQSFKDVTFSDVMVFLEDLPRDMLFAFRVGNLIRGIHRELFLDHLVDPTVDRDVARGDMLNRIRDDPVVRSQVSRANAERLAVQARYAVVGRWGGGMVEREGWVRARVEGIERVGRLRGKPLGGGVGRRSAGEGRDSECQLYCSTADGFCTILAGTFVDGTPCG